MLGECDEKQNWEKLEGREEREKVVVLLRRVYAYFYLSYLIPSMFISQSCRLSFFCTLKRC